MKSGVVLAWGALFLFDGNANSIAKTIAHSAILHFR